MTTTEDMMKEIQKLATGSGSEACNAMVGLLDEILGGTTVKAREFKDDAEIDTPHLLDTVAYDQLTVATDAFSDALTTLRSGRKNIEVSFFLLQRSGKTQSEIEEKMGMIDVVEKELTSAINEMTDRYRSLILSIGSL